MFPEIKPFAEPMESANSFLTVLFRFRCSSEAELGNASAFARSVDADINEKSIQGDHNGFYSTCLLQPAL